MLAVLTLLTSCIVAIPAGASSAGDEPVYVTATNSAMKSEYSSEKEKVEAEISLGYTYLYAQNEQFELYANKYTGEVYLRNRYTGQYLTTNPIDVAKPSTFGNTTDAQRMDMLSQIWISYTDILSGTTVVDASSFNLAAQKGQISISKIKNGIRVEYVLGDTVSRYAIPEVLLHEDYVDSILVPMQTEILDVFENLVDDYPLILSYASSLTAFDKCEYTGEVGDPAAFSSYWTGLNSSVTSTFSNAYRSAWNKAQTDVSVYAALLQELKVAGAIDEHALELPTYNMFRKWITGILTNYKTLTSFYTTFDPNTVETINEEFLKLYPAIANADPETGLMPVIWILSDEITANKKASLQNILTSVNTSYTVDEMLSQEAKVGFKYAEKPRPVFRCALEYVIDEDGMTYTLPANSISFDESKYRLDNISILRYFAANDRNDEGYLFFPDGSGALIYNEDVTTNVIKQPVYGYDYAYRTIEGKKTQFVRLPVYGAVNTDADTGVSTGFFAIITEGDSLVTLSSGVRDKSPRHLATYQTYIPRPTDVYSITGASNIPVFADFKYVGNYSTKIVMLVDPAFASLVPGSAYTASYVEMARYYREYLINVTETLTELEDSDVNERLPLFIESYGTLKTTEKILTFPVEVDVALTTFGDVQTMHTELSDAGIGNIKFRLIGFYNEGVEGKYPKRLKLMREVGGKKGLRRLLSYAEDNAASGIEIILGVDLMYNYVPWGIGGISKKKTSVRSMDNRYASRQMYDTVYQGFFSYFSLCVSADQLEGLFNKFNKKLSKFDLNALSLDYIAEDLSSNFDEDNSFGREDAKNYLVSALETISSKYGTLLSTGGNVYAIKYLDYLLNAPIDSSRYFCASRTVPFYGMVMHGALEYAGTPFNETGNPDYEILRAIESGAAMYYVLCYRNTDLMKEDFLLSNHYSANYAIWKEDIVRYYNILDYAIGDLQTWQLYDHSFLTVERVVTDAERAAALQKLEDEYFDLLLAQYEATLTQKGALIRELIKAGDAIDAAASDDEKQAIYDELAAQIVGGLDDEVAEMIADLRASDATLTDGTALKSLVSSKKVLLTEGQSLHMTFDRRQILSDIARGFSVSFSSASLAADPILKEAYDRIWNRLTVFMDKYATTSGNIKVATTKVEDYATKSKLSYFTQSLSSDADYKITDYTLDDGSVVMVTYKKGSETVRLLLNFSIFEVRVELDGLSLTLDKYDFVRLDARADGVVDPR